MNRDRLRRIRNWQSSEFYARLVMRPLSILVMLVIADWRWLTPNMVTTGANVAKLAGAAVLAFAPEHAITAALLIQLGLLLDHLDGTIARYRKCGTAFGAFYDKVSDAITWVAICGALGWTAYQSTHDVLLPMAALASAYALLVCGYMKWIVASAEAATQRRPVATAVTHDPPQRTAGEWARWFAESLFRAFWFEEVDLFFWIGLGLVLDRIAWLIWLLAVTQTVQLVIMIVKRVGQVRALDFAKAAATPAVATVNPSSE